MTDRPIIFSAPMVRALLDGRKTQTRRVLKPRPEQNDSGLWVWPPDWKTGIPRYGIGVQTDAEGLVQSLEYDPARRLGYAPGDRLWVREAWQAENKRPPFYRADYPEWPGSWRSPIHMPRSASRITLVVTDVRAQRVQEISEEDAVAEGVRDISAEWGGQETFAVPGFGCHNTARMAFAELWESIHGPGAWARDDWVAALTFRREDAA